MQAVKLFFLLFIHTGFLFAYELDELRKSPYQFSVSLDKQIYLEGDLAELQIHLTRGGLNVAGKSVQIAVEEGGAFENNESKLVEMLTDERGEIIQKVKITAAEVLKFRVAFVNPRSGYYEHLEKVEAEIRSPFLMWSYLGLSVVFFIALLVLTFCFQGKDMCLWERWKDIFFTAGFKNAWPALCSLYSCAFISLFFISNHWIEVVFLSFLGTVISLSFFEKKTYLSQAVLILSLLLLWKFLLYSQGLIHPFHPFIFSIFFLFPHVFLWGLGLALLTTLHTDIRMLSLVFAGVVVCFWLFFRFRLDQLLLTGLRRVKSPKDEQREMK